MNELFAFVQTTPGIITAFIVVIIFLFTRISNRFDKMDDKFDRLIDSINTHRITKLESNK